MSVFTILASDVPLREVPPLPGLEIILESGKEAEYRNAGEGFAVFESVRFLELASEKECFFHVELYGSGRAGDLAAYLREQAETAGEIEFWHVWLDGDFDHRVRKVEITSDELTVEDVRELLGLEVWREDPVTGTKTDYCYLLKK